MRLMNALSMAAMVLVLSGCATKWKASWHEAGEPNPTDESRKLMDVARAKFEKADDAVKLLDSIAAHHRVIVADPGNIEALTMLGNQYILLGTAYTDGKSAKSAYFHDAMKYCELAMYTNPEFKKKVDAGATPWEAADTIGKREAAAVLFWVTALQYDFKEGMGLPGKIINVKRLKHALPLLDRIEKIDPDFGGGAVEFAKTICYYALPRSMGGDKDLGNKYMAKSFRKRNDWLFGRWARGKYYQAVTGNKDGVKQDLEWVVAQDLNKFQDPYPWRVHFQDDARQLLGR